MKVLWVVEEFDTGEWNRMCICESREEAREEARRFRQKWGGKTRILKYILAK